LIGARFHPERRARLGVLALLLTACTLARAQADSNALIATLKAELIAVCQTERQTSSELSPP
jgi:hypothetical protein